MKPEKYDTLMNCIDSLHGLMLAAIALEEQGTEYTDLFTLFKEELGRDIEALRKVVKK